MTSNILFGAILTILVFELSQWIAKKTKLTLLNPLLVSSMLIIALLLILKIPYSDFDQGGKYFTMLITHATVSLAIPLYKNLDTLKKNAKVIALGVAVAILGHFVFILLLSLAFNLDQNMALSLIPKSITTAFAKDISTRIGGIEIITVSVVIVTGIFGATISDFVCKKFKFKNDVAIGLALGSSAHAIGTSKAVENNEIQATFSSLALIVTGITTVLVSPFFASILKLIIK